MITKKIVAELVILRLSGGNPSFASKLDERDIFAATDIMIPALLEAEIKENRRRGSYEINGAWFTAFENVHTNYNKKRKEGYINLPTGLISIAGDRGVMVYPMEDQSSPYIMTNNNSQHAYKFLEAGAVPNTCYVEGNRVYFPNFDRRKKFVLVKMIAGTDGLDEYKPLSIPASMEDQLLERLVLKFKDQIATREKKTNDNNVNTI